MRPRGMRSAGWMVTVTPGRKSTCRGSRTTRGSCRSAPERPTGEAHTMALKLPKLFGEKPVALSEDDFDIPTTQVKMGAAAPAGYDPLASVSIMEQLRTAQATAGAPRKIPLIGGLPSPQQEQVLGLMLVLFLLVAGLMWWLDGRIATQQSAQVATATEMQMLSQRLARGSALAAQGAPQGFAAVRNSRDRFKADFEALVSGGTVKGVGI